MSSLPLRIIASHYCVDDLPGASIPHAQLQKLLNRLQCGEQLSQISLAFLQQRGLHALYDLAIGKLTYDKFRAVALTEQAMRVQNMLAHKKEERMREAAREQQRQLAYDQATAARLARENDPHYQARINNQKLRARYGITISVKQQHFGRLMSILKKVDTDQRLSEDDLVWLSTVGKDYFTDAIRTAYHRLEADFFAKEFHKTHNPWAAVNASSHYRKFGRAEVAHTLLDVINVEQQPSKIRAALCTTHGGALRDLKRWDEARHLGERAHALQPRDYRPCTLLGAIYMETGSLDLGKAWYDKAIERGAKVHEVDRDIRTILSRLPQPQHSELENFLLQEDPTRYVWIQKQRQRDASEFDGADHNIKQTQPVRRRR